LNSDDKLQRVFCAVHSRLFLLRSIILRLVLHQSVRCVWPIGYLHFAIMQQPDSQPLSHSAPSQRLSILLSELKVPLFAQQQQQQQIKVEGKSEKRRKKGGRTDEERALLACCWIVPHSHPFSAGRRGSVSQGSSSSSRHCNLSVSKSCEWCRRREEK
jgi:hypothetical protein